MRYCFAVISLVLAGLSYLSYAGNRDARGPVDDATAKYTVDVRHPLDSQMVALAPSADMGTQVFAMAAINDAMARTRLTGLSREERRAWLDVPLYLDDELAAAADLLLGAVELNPGWPLHRYLLGKVAYIRDRRSLGIEVNPGRWLVPLRSALDGAPNHAATIETTAGVILEAWRTLSPEERAIAPGVIRSSFFDGSFVSKAFDVSVDILGRDESMSYVPEEPAPLLSAMQVIGRSGDVRGAAELHARWEAAEWSSRESDLAAMRERRSRGDLNGLLGAAANWGSRHRAADFDDDRGRKQVAEVLALWPRDQIGGWTQDRRGELVRFLLDRDTASDRGVLASNVAALHSVPLVTKARVFLLVGQVERAEKFVLDSGSDGSFEWTSYHVDRARRLVASGNSDLAIAVLQRVAPAARGECDVVVVRRLAGEPIEAPQIASVDADGEIIPNAWSSNGMLGICVDPLTMAERQLEIGLTTDGDSLVEWRVDGARQKTFLVDSQATLALPLEGLEGRHVVEIKTLFGGKITGRHARLIEHELTASH